MPSFLLFFFKFLKTTSTQYVSKSIYMYPVSWKFMCPHNWKLYRRPLSWGPHMVSKIHVLNFFANVISKSFQQICTDALGAGVAFFSFHRKLPLVTLNWLNMIARMETSLTQTSHEISAKLNETWQNGHGIKMWQYLNHAVYVHISTKLSRIALFGPNLYEKFLINIVTI